MKQVLQNLKTGKTEVLDVPIPQLRKGNVLVQTAASLVSAGTERNLVSFAEKNLVGKAQSRPDLVKQVIDKARREGLLTTFESAMNRLDQPLSLGYSSCGTVVEAAEDVSGFKPGDRVVCAGGGHAVHAEYGLIPENLIAHLPDGVDFESGAFATMGAIALNGIRLANPQLGDKVAIIGLGLLGLITAQWSKPMAVVSTAWIFRRARGFCPKIGYPSRYQRDLTAELFAFHARQGFRHHPDLCRYTIGRNRQPGRPNRARPGARDLTGCSRAAHRAQRLLRERVVLSGGAFLRPGPLRRGLRRTRPGLPRWIRALD